MTRNPRKRANGEGTIYELPNGMFKATVTVGFRADGKPIRKSANGKTKREALRRAQEKVIAYHTPGPVVTSDEKVSVYLRGWLESGRVQGKVAPATLKNYIDSVRRIDPHLGNVRLDEIKATHVQQALDKLAKRYSASTVHLTRAVIRHAFEAAVEQELLQRNPVKYAHPPRVERVERNVLTTAQARLLFEHTSEPKIRTLFMVLASCGLRVGEALNLTWDDIDGEWLIVRKGKTRAAARTIPLTPEVQAALRRRSLEQAEDKMKNRDVWEETNLIFTSNVGHRIYQPWVWRVFKRSLKSAGLPDMRVHDLRRTAVLWMREAGIDADVVRDVLGHAHISTTIEIYGTVNKERLEAAREKLVRYMEREA